MEEIEVFNNIKPVVNKCYQHIEATRSEWQKGEGNYGYLSDEGKYRYFSKNKPTYVGEFIREEQSGYGASHGDGGSVIAVFRRGGEEVSVKYSSEGFTCFKEVQCSSVPKGSEGGRRKRKTRKARRNIKYKVYVSKDGRKRPHTISGKNGKEVG